MGYDFIRWMTIKLLVCGHGPGVCDQAAARTGQPFSPSVFCLESDIYVYTHKERDANEGLSWIGSFPSLLQQV